MENYLSHLQWIDSQYETMVTLVDKWSRINSHSENLAGLATMLSTLKDDFKILDGEVAIHSLSPRRLTGKQGNKIEIPLGQVLSIKKRPKAALQVFLNGHMDTVFPLSSPFQHVEYLDANTMQGPGVTDLKGGLAIMLKALEALERSPYAERIGWEIFINSDEEIGSPGSFPFLQKAATRHHIGLIFEPAFADGAFVSGRKGSVNYTIIARGRAAHAGRDFSKGCNAIYAMAQAIQEIEKINQGNHGVTINVGYIKGGGPINIIPDLAICRLNIRALIAQDMKETQDQLSRILENCRKREGIQLELIQDTFRPPKPFDEKTETLFKHYQSCAEILKIPFHLRESGGTCDGNILSAAGLPTLDSVGVVGGNIHTEKEYLFLPSLVKRAQLVALFLFRLATGEINIFKGDSYA